MQTTKIVKNKKKNHENARRISCLRCEHDWIYSVAAKPRYRIRCPMCHSSQNEFNRRTFGKWSAPYS
ncbi:hypothetical protein K0U27_06855 [archaeon]|nr:hypothetical protein [archaeon]